MESESETMNVLDLGDTLINMKWFMFADIRRRKDEEGEPLEDGYKVTFYFADGRGAQHMVKVDNAGLDSIREAMV